MEAPPSITTRGASRLLVLRVACVDGFTNARQNKVIHRSPGLECFVPETELQRKGSFLSKSLHGVYTASNNHCEHHTYTHFVFHFRNESFTQMFVLMFKDVNDPTDFNEI